MAFVFAWIHCFYGGFTTSRRCGICGARIYLIVAASNRATPLLAVSFFLMEGNGSCWTKVRMAASKEVVFANSFIYTGCHMTSVGTSQYCFVVFN